MLSADQLLAAAAASGHRQMVTVNQKDLIDKMLARYSSDFVVARELIQNGDDAGATLVKVSFQTIKKKSKPTVVTEICISNNGRVFQDCDWNRVSRIAEGNPDVDTVGMFGVGFYS